MCYCMDMKKPRDWYTVSIKQVRQSGGTGLLNHYAGSLIRALKAVYPHHEWTSYRYSTPHQISKHGSFFSKNQYALFQVLKKVSR